MATAVLASLALAAPAFADAADAIPGQYVVGKAGQAMPSVVHTTAAGAAALRRQAGVRYVEPNYVIHAAQDNDPLFDQQWALAQSDSLDAQDAWIQSQGAGVVVAVVDTGVDQTHPDLAGSLWTNPGEIPGNGIDDDRDGFVDDVHGADFINNDGNPQDDEGHGTHVAGIIAAAANNAIGGAGLAPQAKIMAVKVLDSNLAGTAAGLAQGIQYAVTHGAKIINASVNGDGQSQALENAIQQARAAGVILVASAGNDSRNLDSQPSYPAAYPDDNIVSVAASTQSGAMASFSNYGQSSVDLAAPGDQIVSTAKGGDYEIRSGTSMAAPFTAATLALMASARPELSGTALRAALFAGTKHPASLNGLVADGELDPIGALHQVIPATAWRTVAAAVPPAGTSNSRAVAQTSRATRHHLSVRLPRRRGERLVKARIYVNGRHVRTLRGHNLRRVRLTVRLAPGARAVVRVVGRTNRGHRVRLLRAYRA